MGVFAAAAAKARTGVFSRETYGCWGGGVGLGFGNCYETFPGGISGFCSFLADGNNKTEQGRAIGEQLAAGAGKRMADDFLLGERYLKTSEVTRRFLDFVPMREVPTKYVVVTPLEAADPERDDIKSVTLLRRSRPLVGTGEPGKLHRSRQRKRCDALGRRMPADGYLRLSRARARLSARRGGIRPTCLRATQSGRRWEEM